MMAMTRDALTNLGLHSALVSAAQKLRDALRAASSVIRTKKVSRMVVSLANHLLKVALRVGY